MAVRQGQPYFQLIGGVEISDNATPLQKLPDVDPLGCDPAVVGRPDFGANQIQSGGLYLHLGVGQARSSHTGGPLNFRQLGLADHILFRERSKPNTLGVKIACFHLRPFQGGEGAGIEIVIVLGVNAQ